MMIKLVCVIVGVEGSVFSVKVDDGDLVVDLKKAIKAEKTNDLRDIDADKLQLFLAKGTNDAWLKDDDPAAEQLFEGRTHPHIQQVVGGKQPIATRTLKRWLFEDNKMSQPSAEQIHVLVVVPVVVPVDSIQIHIKEIENDPTYENELTLYQQRGELIQRNCKDYCRPILSKIDALYATSDNFSLPFICVEGSSGMGKSQLAFALGGSRPWFYWPILFGASGQRLYKNFSSISAAFRQVTNEDDPIRKPEEDILNSESDFYRTESLRTFGFIFALLKHCSKDQNQQGQMIHFEEKTLLNVEKCNREKVVAFCEKMKTERKVLPFFVLDEMMPNLNSDGSGGKNLSAFQRNIFRVCGLVVVLMGTDAKVSNLVGQSGGSYAEQHEWMTVISRFPPYQTIPFADDDKETAWNHLQAKYPVLKSIVVNSRGRFARLFADSAVQYAIENFANGIELCHLLDEAFDHVNSTTQNGKRFMEKQEGRYAQLKVISYTNVGSDGTSPRPLKKRKTALDFGNKCMHLHFANLVDDQTTKVDVWDGQLYVNGQAWKPKCCFPIIKKDVLLYLAILGGKTHSSYYDYRERVDHSTLGIFSEYLEGYGSMTDENRIQIKNDGKKYENMVAHMIFSASRRNGVQGIPFDNFFAELLSECQDKIRPVTMIIGDTTETIVASNLLEKYADLAALSRSKIPFLAPPNAKWPPYILDTRAEGCNFGHLVRAKNAERCDIYVRNMEDDSKLPLFLCECKYWDNNVDFGVMNEIIGGIEDFWKEKWAVALVFCVQLASFQMEWNRKEVGCVKVNCRSGRVDWVFQPAREKRKKLVIVMETGPLNVGVRSEA